MAKTPSTMLPLGTKASNFELTDVISNKIMRLDEIKSSTATVIMFICNHCPYVIHIREKLIEVARLYTAKGIRFIAINSNDAIAYPQDGPELMREEAEKHHFPFPYLYDESQSVAKAYQAACTPDFYVFDASLSCVYRGRFDGATPGNSEPVTGIELSNALDAILASKSISADQKPSVGCNIKWRKD